MNLILLCSYLNLFFSSSDLRRANFRPSLDSWMSPLSVSHLTSQVCCPFWTLPLSQHLFLCNSEVKGRPWTHTNHYTMYIWRSYHAFYWEKIQYLDKVTVKTCRKLLCEPIICCTELCEPDVTQEPALPLVSCASTVPPFSPLLTLSRLWYAKTWSTITTCGSLPEHVTRKCSCS